MCPTTQYVDHVRNGQYPIEPLLRQTNWKREKYSENKKTKRFYPIELHRDFFTYCFYVITVVSYPTILHFYPKNELSQIEEIHCCVFITVRHFLSHFYQQF